MSPTIEEIRDVLNNSVYILFKGLGATNYMTFGVRDTDSNELFSITVQKENGLSVADKLSQQEALIVENERYISGLERLAREALESLELGLEDEAVTEPEWSKTDRALVKQLRDILGEQQ